MKELEGNIKEENDTLKNTLNLLEATSKPNTNCGDCRLSHDPTESESREQIESITRYREEVSRLAEIEQQLNRRLHDNAKV